MPKKIILLVLLLVVLSLVGCYIFITKNNQPDQNSIILPTSKEINVQDISQHKSKKDCWVFVGGMVYDATLVIYDNPAYEEKILKTCGGDGSSFFVASKNTDITKSTVSKLYTQLKKHRLGALAP